jgi:hypothetical protein
MWLHINKVHRGKQGVISCNSCGKFCSTLRDMRSHLRKHEKKHEEQPTKAKRRRIEAASSGSDMDCSDDEVSEDEVSEDEASEDEASEEELFSDGESSDDSGGSSQPNTQVSYAFDAMEFDEEDIDILVDDDGMMDVVGTKETPLNELNDSGASQWDAAVVHVDNTEVAGLKNGSKHDGGSNHDGGSEHEGGTEHEGSKKLEWVCQLCTFFNSDDFMCGNCGSFIVQ